MKQLNFTQKNILLAFGVACAIAFIFAFITCKNDISDCFEFFSLYLLFLAPITRLGFGFRNKVLKIENNTFVFEKTGAFSIWEYVAYAGVVFVTIIIPVMFIRDKTLPTFMNTVSFWSLFITLITSGYLFWRKIPSCLTENGNALISDNGFFKYDNMHTSSFNDLNNCSSFSSNWHNSNSSSSFKPSDAVFDPIGSSSLSNIHNFDRFK